MNPSRPYLGRLARQVAALCAAMMIAAMLSGYLDVSTAVPAAAAPNDGTSAGFGWGDNSYGKLGDGTLNRSLAPSSVVESDALAGSALARVSAGFSHSCAITTVGKPVCWGANSFGALGAGEGGDSAVPIAVVTTGVLAGSRVIDIAAGRGFSCAVTESGVAACWGWNAFGQLGTGNATSSAVPVAVATNGVLAGKRIISVSTGDYHACVVAADGSAACWGLNGDGQLGNGTQSSSLVPVEVTRSGAIGGAALAEVSAGSLHTCARAANGLGFCWGNGAMGQLGDDTTASSTLPKRIKLIGSLEFALVRDITAGGEHSCAVISTGLPLCWGANSTGQLGNGTLTQTKVPSPIVQGALPITDTVSTMDAGALSTCALTTAGVASCWGGNRSGQLGIGSTTNSNVPALVVTSTGLGASVVTSISAGQDHALAVISAGTVFVPISPYRVYDSRTDTQRGALVSGSQRTVPTSAAVPSGASAVAYNLTIAETTNAGFLSVAPGDVTQAPATSTINWFGSGQILANGFTVGVDSSRNMAVFAGGGGSTQFLIDITGYFAPVGTVPAGSEFVAIAPQRAYDSRNSGPAGVLATGSSREVAVTPQVPVHSTAIAYNVTVTDTRGAGFLAVAPAGQAVPLSSTVNWTGSGQTLANATMVGVGNGKVAVAAGGGGSTQFIIDVVGYFVPAGSSADGTRFYPTAPVRAYDSRNSGAGGALSGTAGVRNVNIAGGGVVPLGSAAIAYNLTVTNNTASGYMQVAPGGAPQPAVSSINWMFTGQTIANGTTVGVDVNRRISAWTGPGSPGVSTDFIIDIAGYYL